MCFFCCQSSGPADSIYSEAAGPRTYHTNTHMHTRRHACTHNKNIVAILETGNSNFLLLYIAAFLLCPLCVHKDRNRETSVSLPMVRTPVLLDWGFSNMISLKL